MSTNSPCTNRSTAGSGPTGSLQARTRTEALSPRNECPCSAKERPRAMGRVRKGVLLFNGITLGPPRRCGPGLPSRRHDGIGRILNSNPHFRPKKALSHVAFENRFNFGAGGVHLRPYKNVFGSCPRRPTSIPVWASCCTGTRSHASLRCVPDERGIGGRRK
jgi:hypothetical protein